MPGIAYCYMARLVALLLALTVLELRSTARQRRFPAPPAAQILAGQPASALNGLFTAIGRHARSTISSDCKIEATQWQVRQCLAATRSTSTIATSNWSSRA